jgi:cellulose synthase/poly-beta-1,6-N-acetylglucosamine synthase-like glycosyltransferase
MFSIFHCYFGYPFSLQVITLFRRREVLRRPIEPIVTIIVAAYNEEKRIEGKIKNLLDTDYPKDKLEIIIVSDGSTDRTGEIAAGYDASGLKLLTLSEHSGKEYAQSRAVQIAKGEILVFTDVAAQFQPGGVLRVISNFSDPMVGCVSSQDSVICRDETVSGEGIYVRYEMWLRNLESLVHSLVGLSGSFFAARRDLCQDFTSEIDSDFQTVLNAAKAGMRAVIDNEAVCYYEDLANLGKELVRKERTVLRGITVFFSNLSLLNVFKYGFFSYQYLSHKLFRWLVPFFAVAGFLSNAILAMDSIVFFILLALQILFYSIGLLHYFGYKHFNHSLFKIPSYFILVNLSIAIAWLRFLKGERVVKWTPSER